MTPSSDAIKTGLRTGRRVLSIKLHRRIVKQILSISTHRAKLLSSWRIGLGLSHVPALLPLLQTRYHDRRQNSRKLLNIASGRDHLANKAAAGQRVLIAGHDEDRLNTAHCAIRQGQLKLVPEV
jgi:hypothetical protein